MLGAGIPEHAWSWVAVKLAAGLDSARMIRVNTDHVAVKLIARREIRRKVGTD